MEIQIRNRNEKGMLASLAGLVHAEIKDGKLEIPAQKGEGYLAGCIVNEDIQIMIEQYWLSDELKVEHFTAPEDPDTVILIFNNAVATSFSKNTDLPDATICSVEVSEEILPARQERNSVTIAVKKKLFFELFGAEKYGYLHTLFEQSGPFALSFDVNPEMLRVLEAMVRSVYKDDLKRTFFLAKTLELICLIVSELRERPKIKTPLHLLDIKAVYAIQHAFQLHPEQVPVISQLAAEYNMSEVKLRRIFNKITGKGIFESYQFVRMSEAARLLKEHLSVSEAGYRLGFTNLSHFAREFKKQFGCNPKKYAGDN